MAPTHSSSDRYWRSYQDKTSKGLQKEALPRPRIMYMENSDMEEWSIGCCSPDEAGLEFYLKEYKPFRLHALKQDPEGTQVS